MRHLHFDEVLKEELNDPAFKQEWEASETQYQIIKQIISTRLQRKLTQKELAQKAGLKQPSLARIESGSVTPSITTLTKLANALGTTLEIRLA